MPSAASRNGSTPSMAISTVTFPTTPISPWRRPRRSDLSLPLGGVPVAIKDLINVRGQACRCASKILGENYTSPYDATVIRKLREAGAVPFGRANMDEFAMGSSTENSAYGPTRNPWDTTPHSRRFLGRIGRSRVRGNRHRRSRFGHRRIDPPTGPPCAESSDLKPSYGRVSRYGLVAFASSLDQIGPMTGNVEDSALLLQAISGSDERDSTCLDDAVPDLPRRDRSRHRGTAHRPARRVFRRWPRPRR